MTHWQAVRQITSWEFRRFLRPRELITTVLMTALLGAGIPLVTSFLTGRNATETITLAVPQAAALPDSERFEYVELDEAAALRALDAGEIGGILDLENPEQPLLLVERERAWSQELGLLLSQAAVSARLDASQLSPAEFAELTRPVELQVAVTAGAGDRGTLPVVVTVGLLILAIFIGTGLLFTAITGEKTQRVTEQIISAVSPQAWIDGKVLGTGLYVLVNMTSILLGIALAVAVPSLIRSGGLPPLPVLAAEPLLLVAALVFAVLGGALYFLLFAAVAATIDDPATSQRSGMIMLPGMFVGLGFIGLIGGTGNALFRFMSHFPLTSPSAMPVRILQGEVGTAEVLAALAILIAAVLLARRLAGRIFALGILMTGKEPGWREMLRWLGRT